MSVYTSVSLLVILFASKMSWLSKTVVPPNVSRSTGTSLLIFHKDREEMLHNSVVERLYWCSDIVEIFCSKCTGFESHLEYMEWDFAWVALVCLGGFGCDHFLWIHHSLFAITSHCLWWFVSSRFTKKKNRLFLNNLRISNPVAYVLAECHVTFGSYCHFLLLFGFQLSLFY
jgi:hypothetical protein